MSCSPAWAPESILALAPAGIPDGEFVGIFGVELVCIPGVELADKLALVPVCTPAWALVGKIVLEPICILVWESGCRPPQWFAHTLLWGLACTLALGLACTPPLELALEPDGTLHGEFACTLAFQFALEHFYILDEPPALEPGGILVLELDGILP